MENNSDFEKQIQQAAEDSGLFMDLLTHSVKQKLETSFEELKQLLYRLDVSESKVQKVFREFPQKEWPGAIASLIIDREKQRLEFRKRYSAGKTRID